MVGESLLRSVPERQRREYDRDAALVRGIHRRICIARQRIHQGRSYVRRLGADERRSACLHQRSVRPVRTDGDEQPGCQAVCHLGNERTYPDGQCGRSRHRFQECRQHGGIRCDGQSERNGEYRLPLRELDRRHQRYAGGADLHHARP